MDRGAWQAAVYGVAKSRTRLSDFPSLDLKWFVLCALLELPGPVIWYLILLWTPLVPQMVKCLSTMQETPIRSLGREGPLEKEMATHSSILA